MRYLIVLLLFAVGCSGPLDVNHESPESAALSCFVEAGYKADSIPEYTVSHVQETGCKGENIMGCAYPHNHIEYVGDNPSRRIQIHELLHLLYYEEAPGWAHHQMWPDELPQWCLDELDGSY